MIGGFIFSVIFKFLPGFVDLSWLYDWGFAVANADGVYEIPFIDRMGFVFLICVTGMFFISVKEYRKGVATNGLEIDTSMFKVSNGFLVGAIIVTAIIAALYTFFW